MTMAVNEKGLVLRGIWSHRYLTFSLVRRQYQLRYRQSLIGLAWAVLPSLVTIAAATLVFHKVARLNTGQVPYPIFTFAALVPWAFLAGSLSYGISSLTNNQAIISRIPFPKATLPLSAIGTALIDLLISGVVYVVFAIATGYGIPATIAWFPVILTIETLLVSGVVLLGAALNVFARDVKLVVPLFTQLWLFLTPVLYPLQAVPSRLRPLYDLNPMTGIVESSRRILLYGHAPIPMQLLPAIVGAGVLFAAGVWYFGATESRFADVL